MGARLDGKVAIVTGGSSGMGRAMASRLARDGAAVVVHYAGRRGIAEEVARDVQDRGGEAVAVGADLTAGDAAARLVDAAERAFGGLDILILNAGAPLLSSPLVDTDDARFDGVFAVNVRANFLLLKHAVPRLRDGGRVVAFSTPYVVRAQADRSVIAASKAALQAMVLGLSKEAGPRGITANVVIPGATDTGGFRDAVPDEAVPAIVGMTPLGRLGRPEDVADAVAFLCSEDARWVTGQVLPVTGGLL